MGRARWRGFVSTQSKSRHSLDPDEWDFRGLNPEHLCAALDYEQMREHRHIPEASALVTPERLKEIEDVTFDQVHRDAEWKLGWIGREHYEKLEFAFYACRHWQGFPKPWMALCDSARTGNAERWGKPHQPLWIMTRDDLRFVEGLEDHVAKLHGGCADKLTQAEALRPIRRYIIAIDWSDADALLKPALLALLKLRPEGVGPRKRHTGKGAAAPMHRLKQLAAWRLARQAGLNYKDAQRHIDQRRKECQKYDPNALLPVYGSAGAWKDAVDAGDRIARHYR